MLHLTTKTYTVHDTKCLYTKKNEAKAVATGVFKSNLHKERAMLLELDKLTQAQEEYLDLIEKTLKFI